VKDRYELKSYLRFQLEQLSSKNQQHLFEELAFELARQRVSRNILPATGPVQAGGDQGRDFESFRTYLGATGIGAQSFVAHSDGKLLAFACTLQKTLLGKIRADLAVIFGSGERPDGVVYFAAADLPVARRHALQQFCRGKYNASLEIFDGQAIADLLCDADTFWIAERFLAVPAELFPQVETDEAYQTLRTRWFGGERAINSFSDFLEVKRGLRRATFDETLRHDLGRWSNFMQEAVERAGHGLQQKLLYEISVAQLRGRGTLDSAQWAVERFFDQFDPDDGIGAVEDALVLASYAMSAHRAGHFQTSLEAIEAWGRRPRAALDALLAADLSDASRFRLLLAQPHGAFADREEMTPDRLADIVLTPWEAAASIAERSPYADVDYLEGLLSTMLPIVGTHPRFRALSDKVDRIVSNRSGKFAAAEQGRKRAGQYIALDQWIPAIEQLQRSKEGWFSAETMRESVMAMMMLAEAYSKLNLPLASRYYAASALLQCLLSEDDRVHPLTAQAAILLADTYMMNGEGLSYLAAAGGAAAIHMGTATDPDDLELHPNFAAMLAQVIQIRALLLQLAPHLEATIDDCMDRWTIDPAYVRGLKQLAGGPPWSTMSRQEISEKLAEELGQGLFNDAGEHPVIQWSALGIRWTVRSAAADRAQAERVAAALQIAHVDFAEDELLIVPSNVDIDVKFGTGLRPELRQKPDNGMLQFEVTLPTAGESDEGEFTFSAITLVLLQATAHSTSAFMKLVEARMKAGLLTKAFWIAPVAPMLADARSTLVQPIPALSAIEVDPDWRSPTPITGPGLEWPTTPGPGYSWDRAKEALENRYRRTLKFGRLVIPLLQKNPAIRQVLEGMHRNGMLDWQILNCLLSITVQLSIEDELGRPMLGGDADILDIQQRALRRVEVGNLPTIDLARFGQQTIDMQMMMNHSASLQGWDLHIHRSTPDFEAMKRLLDVRYRHSTDDIDHEELFGWAT
jgi:hypothetical protein